MTKNTDNIRFSTILEALPDTVPFVAPEELERHSGRSFSARVGANESAFGLSPLAEKALHEAIGVQGCSWYGDPKSYNLKQLLSERLGVLPEQLCVDSGIDSLLGLTARLFLDAGDVMVTSKGAYPTVNFHAKGVGGVIHTVPYRDHHEDPEALAQAAIENNARLVYLANPDNPMGTQLDPSDIQTLIDALPTQCVLMLDEAYCEFMSREQSLAIDTRQTNVIRFRTFSKAYGMAGMRIGYAIGNASIIRGYDKIRNHGKTTHLCNGQGIRLTLHRVIHQFCSRRLNQQRQSWQDAHAVGRKRYLHAKTHVGSTRSLSASRHRNQGRTCRTGKCVRQVAEAALSAEGQPC